MDRGIASTAAISQGKGIAFLKSLAQAPRRSASASSISSCIPSCRNSPAPASAPAAPLTRAELDARQAEACKSDHLIAETELERYINEGLLEDEFNPAIYWDQKEKSFPLLFQVALDILPAQASSFAFKQERLSFTSDLIAREEDYTIERNLSDAAVRELLAEGNFVNSRNS
ncbi:hypothetical protein A0H81_02846 [Grifola frondosa]|uniref:HAT C-terminal dimerisation domain-containing protein n=1 Tax=Grifola frondosa TaxID=5627 RepID=A0A1C7MK77_GRIFR|nr:hypothetical protein A0H81_02846 [Grifola frondosa]